MFAGRPLRHVAESLGVAESLLGKWKRQGTDQSGAMHQPPNKHLGAGVPTPHDIHDVATLVGSDGVRHGNFRSYSTLSFRRVLNLNSRAGRRG